MKYLKLIVAILALFFILQHINTIEIKNKDKAYSHQSGGSGNTYKNYEEQERRIVGDIIGNLKKQDKLDDNIKREIINNNNKMQAENQKNSLLGKIQNKLWGGNGNELNFSPFTDDEIKKSVGDFNLKKQINKKLENIGEKRNKKISFVDSMDPMGKNIAGEKYSSPNFEYNPISETNIMDDVDINLSRDKIPTDIGSPSYGGIDFNKFLEQKKANQIEDLNDLPYY